MATCVHYKRWGLILVLVALLGCVLLAIRKPPPTTASAVAIKFVGYTNLPNDDLRFALFSVSNQASYAIRWRGNWVELEGSQDHKAETVNPSLPGYTYDPVLKMGESVDFAVGEPSDAKESGRWRFSVSFTRYSVQERWFDFSWRHKLPTEIGPLVLVDSQRILSRTNHVTVSTEWLTK